MELGRLAPGDCFGEGGLLTGAPELGTVKALTLVVAYEIAQDSLAPLMRDRPMIAEDLALLLARRMENQQQLLPSAARGSEHGSVQRLLDRMRHLFEIRHGGQDA